jgi:hypothetical protein
MEKREGWEERGRIGGGGGGGGGNRNGREGRKRIEGGNEVTPTDRTINYTKKSGVNITRLSITLSRTVLKVSPFDSA